MLADHLALAGADFPFSRWQLRDRRHLGVAVDAGAQLPRTFGERLGDISRCNVTIVGVVDCAQKFGTALHQGPQIQGLFGCENHCPHALSLGNRCVIQVFVHPVSTFGNAQLSALVPADTLAGLCFQVLVDVYGFLDQTTNLVGERVDRNESCCMPGRACGQFGTLEQADIRPAALREAVQHVYANSATTDNNHSCM